MRASPLSIRWRWNCMKWNWNRFLWADPMKQWLHIIIFRVKPVKLKTLSKWTFTKNIIYFKYCLIIIVVHFNPIRLGFHFSSLPFTKWYFEKLWFIYILITNFLSFFARRLLACYIYGVIILISSPLPVRASVSA